MLVFLLSPSLNLFVIGEARGSGFAPGGIDTGLLYCAEVFSHDLAAGSDGYELLALSDAICSRFLPDR